MKVCVKTLHNLLHCDRIFMGDKMQIKREIYLEKIRPYYNIDLIKVLTGIRRCGKSILLKQIMEELIDTGIEKSNIIYLNFEDFEFDEINNAKKLNDYLKTLMVLESKYYLFFDEIQHVDEFEKILASLKATKNCSIFVTGSNSKLLSGDLATLLVGRTVEFKIFPFCFQEVVDYYKINSKNIDENLIYDYIKYGGMPQRFELSKDEEIINYLKDHYNGICEKDIFKKNSLIEKYKFNTIASYILANAGREFNAENIVSYFNTNNENNKKSIEKKTIYNYLEKMEKAYLISRVKRFNIVGKEELKTKEKQYAIDMGLRIINTNLIDYDDTFFLENIIYNELLVRGYEIFTGKTKKGEIDFVAIKGAKKCFIQVAYLLANESTIKREFGAFECINDASPKYVLSLDKIDMSRNGITHINIIDFLLKKVNLYLS